MSSHFILSLETRPSDSSTSFEVLVLGQRVRQSDQVSHSTVVSQLLSY
jgi:hypothetical protein